jgi:Uncharacterized protein conserved in bacteria (DUF2188)
MADGYVHTVYKAGSWLNEIEGGSGSELPEGHFLKDAAVEAGREEAINRKTEHIIHNQDGTISERNSYGNDPSRRPG